jgi:hypothetical protein
VPKLTQTEWEDIRAGREAGQSFRVLAGKYPITMQAIQKRAKAEGWGDGTDIGKAVLKKAADKVVGLVVTDNPQKKAAAIDAAARKMASVIETHRAEWRDHRDRFGSVPNDFDDGKLAKISSEILSIRQKGERVAHGIDNQDDKPTIVIERSYGSA